LEIELMIDSRLLLRQKNVYIAEILKDK